MNVCRWMAVASLLALPLGLGGPVLSQGAGPIDLKVVKYPELAKIVAGYKGKVVLVDLWQRL